MCIDMIIFMAGTKVSYFSGFLNFKWCQKLSQNSKSDTGDVILLPLMCDQKVLYIKIEFIFI